LCVWKKGRVPLSQLGGVRIDIGKVAACVNDRRGANLSSAEKEERGEKSPSFNRGGGNHSNFKYL